MAIEPELSRVEQDRLSNVILENAARSRETLRLFRAQGHQEGIFSSTASELLVQGGNRAGKSLCVAAEFASACTGIPIIGSNGKHLAYKYPTDRPLTCWIIGFGSNHCGDTIHRLLFRRDPNLRMLRDEEGNWKIYNPWLDPEKKLYKETRMAPPLIPPRMINEWGWQNKSIRHFDVCRLKPRPGFGKGSPGTSIHYFTSKAEVKMGDPVDLIWIDERIQFSNHYTEWQARISDRGGRIIWSVWPGNVNDALTTLIKRTTSGDPDAERVLIRHSDNRFISPEQRKKNVRAWRAQGGDEEVRSRDEGEMVFGKYRMYPAFSEQIHATPSKVEVEWDAVDREIAKTGGTIPKNGKWSRHIVIDPGHAHPGVLFVAVPPPDLTLESGPVAVVYDCLHMPMTDANAMARAIQVRSGGIPYETFIIDSHAARHTPMGFSKTVRTQYAEQFSNHRMASRLTGSDFQLASDDLDGGCNMVRNWLTVGNNGRPRLRYTRNCSEFEDQMTRYQKTVGSAGVSIDKPAARQVDPLCDCVRYFCCADPQYRTPQKVSGQPSPHYLYFKGQWQREGAPKRKSNSVNLGPYTGDPT